MDTSQPLADVDSFSYSWLINKPKPPVESIDDDDGGLPLDRHDIATFIEMDPTLSNRWSKCSQDFDFSLPCPEPTAMAHADQMFCDGLLLPQQLISETDQEKASACSLEPVLLRSFSLDSSQRMISASKRHRWCNSHAVPSRPVSLNSSPLVIRGAIAMSTMSRSSSLSKGAVLRATKLRLPSFGSCGKLSKGFLCKYFSFLVPLYDKVVKRLRRMKATEKVKAKASGASSSVEFYRGKVCDLGRENAIKDAILHCKKSM